MSFMRDEEHVETLKASIATVGVLQHALREKGTERILVGRHRVWADPKCPITDVEVKSDLHRELIIVHGQVQRGLSEEEAKMRILRIAKILVRQGISRDKVASHLVEKKLLPWTERRIHQLLPKEYKMKTGPKQPRKNRNVSISKQELEVTGAVEVVAPAVASSIPVATSMPNEPAFPFPDCRCKECDHRAECGY